MTEMDIGVENEVMKKCYKIKDRLFDSLKIVYNESNSMCMLWNKYQIFVYENHNFEDVSKTFVPEFQVCQLINCNNYIICLDFTGNVHVTSLKFKNTAQKRFRTTFQPREQGILSLATHNLDILCLKYDTNTHYLTLHEVDADFHMKKKVMLKFKKEQCPPTRNDHTKYIIYSYSITKTDFELIKDLFDVKATIGKDYNIILISFDKISVYGCLLNTKSAEDEISLIKLYTSPSEICDLKMASNDNILIGLTIGTIIRLPLKDFTKKPDVIYLNTALSTFLTSKANDTLIYTDGISIWKSENTFLKQGIKYIQFFAKHIKDFMKLGDQLVCTTYSNLIYTFPIEDEISYLTSTSVDEYHSAETLLNNAEYFYRILREVEKSNELNKMVHQEESYITALALSQRQDIMDKTIQHKVIVYETYEDAIKENTDITLTEDMKNYFETDSFYFLIKLTTTIIHHTFDQVLSNLFGDLKIHINISSDQGVLKTTSIKLNELLKKLHILIPLNVRTVDTSQIILNIKLVTNIPGALDERQTIWTVLYRKNIVLNSEYFIKPNIVTNKNISLKEPEETLENLIVKAADTHHGNLFAVTDISKQIANTPERSLYAKLPDNFVEILKIEEPYSAFNPKKADFLLKHFTSDEFLKSKSNLCFEIGNDKVKLEIVNDFYCPVLKVSSNNMKMAFHIRNFFANLVHNDFEGYGPGMEFINNALYTTIENLRKSVKKCLANGSQEQFLALAEQFQMNVIGALPI